MSSKLIGFGPRLSSPAMVLLHHILRICWVKCLWLTPSSFITQNRRIGALYLRYVHSSLSTDQPLWKWIVSIDHLLYVHIFGQINQQTGVRHRKLKPTLMNYRTGKHLNYLWAPNWDEKMFFGSYFINDKSGVIHRGTALKMMNA